VDGGALGHNIRTFKAKLVSAVELPDLNAFAVILAQNPDGSGARLEIQRALSFDEQDKQLGQDTYCVSTEEGATHYGGIASWRFADNGLEIALDAGAATSLGFTGFAVELEANGDTRRVLKEGLERVLNAYN